MGKQGNRRTRNHRKETLFSQPQVGGRPQLQGSQHSVKDTELFLKIAVLVYPFFCPPRPRIQWRDKSPQSPRASTPCSCLGAVPTQRGKKST